MWVQCIEMSSRTIRNMQSLIDGAAAGDGYSKMMLEGMAEERHRKENPEYYKRVVYNPGYSGLRDVDRTDVTNSFIEDQKKEINSDLDAMYRPTSSNDVVVSGKTPRKRTPTKEDQELANLEKIANQQNIQIAKSGNGYKVFQNKTLIATMAGIGFLIVFLMALLFPKMKHDSQNAGTSRKNKKSSRRNRK
jgi:hypothetical protein